MAKFIIHDKVYDTSKMMLIGKVKKWYAYRNFYLQYMFGEGAGREYDCELYRSDKGNWLLVHDGERCCTGEAITEEEAKFLLKRDDYDSYVKEYGESEEA